MDRIVELIVRALSALGACARVLPGVEYARWQPGQKLKVLLAGYNGARNTGSDVRVAALAQQMRERFGDAVEISVMSLDVPSTARYFDADVRQIPFTTLFFGALYRACSEHHVVILCEGSTLKSTFANALTLYNCEAAGVARAQGKPCIAYGSEVGAMDPFLERAARDLCSDVRFCVRSRGSLAALQGLGLDGVLGTDTAWTFDSAPGRDEALALLRAGGWDGEKPLLGIAPVNPFCWPVKPSVTRLVRSSITGDWSQRYARWYYFSWSEERERKFDRYLEALAEACSTFAAERGFQPVIFGMEQLDAEACERLAARMGGSMPVFLSRDVDGFVIAEALRSLRLLVTSRYHAQVLATAALVPTVAVSMDERLDNLAAELGLGDDYLLHVGDAHLAERVLLALDDAHDASPAIRAQLQAGLDASLARLDAMGDWLETQLPLA
ncbi:MAG: polysaccharide pyruvyl transferase family protein [Coriobacteriia bacterium]|nr:polysaccharide pyruvyl transferase family protein [Coriobacteriia bacterium]